MFDKNSYMRQYYCKGENKEKTKARIYKRRKDRNEFVAKLKDQPCTDCGQKFPPCVMDFDHVRGEKVNSISTLMTGNMQVLLDELEKCELVCANCHRIRTWIIRK